jgi:hypothetical protein
VCWPIAVLTAVFGVKLESAAGAAPEGLAEVITGPVGHRPLGLVQQRGRRANADLRVVSDTAAREHVDHLGWAGGSLDREASDARRDGLALPGRRDSAGWGEPDRHAAGGGLHRANRQALQPFSVLLEQMWTNQLERLAELAEAAEPEPPR